jgi:hypothetical protein
MSKMRKLLIIAPFKSKDNYGTKKSVFRYRKGCTLVEYPKGGFLIFFTQKTYFGDPLFLGLIAFLIPNVLKTLCLTLYNTSIFVDNCGNSLMGTLVKKKF